MAAKSKLCASPISVLGKDCLRASLLSRTHLADPRPTNLVSRTWLTRVSSRLPLAARIGRWKKRPKSCIPREFWIGSRKQCQWFFLNLTLRKNIVKEDLSGKMTTVNTFIFCVLVTEWEIATHHRDLADNPHAFKAPCVPCHKSQPVHHESTYKACL